MRFVLFNVLIALCCVVITQSGCDMKPSQTADQSAPSTTAEGLWLTDYATAQEISRRERKPLFLLFTGTDWCPWCVRLEKEALSAPEFAAWAKDNLVLLKLDFLQFSPQPQKLINQNSALRQKYNIEAFPTVLITTSDGEIIAQTGYQEGGGASYVAHLKTLLGK